MTNNYLHIRTMKKTLLLAALFAAGFGANAQEPQPLPDGTPAPDFTMTDINNETHTLHADYLDQGKTVIMDVSATWCGPCWGYHGTHALADLYEAYGPEGSDEVMVLFVEGDPGTSVESIYGTNTAEDVSVTQGNWTIGSPYPIIDDATGDLGEDYSIVYFPTVYQICSDTKVTKLVNQMTAVQLRNSINICQPLTGVPNHGMINPPTSVIRLCESGDATDIQAKLKNFGNNNITTATVELRKDGVMVATTEYTGNLAQFGNAANINFDDIVLEEGAEYTVNLITINGATPHNAELTEAPITFEVASTGENNMIEVVVYTDLYAHEASWQIKDASGDVVAEGGDYEEGPLEYGGGGPDANTDIHEWVTLPVGDAQCYTVVLKDAFGDGWMYIGEGGNADENHGIEIYSSGELVYQKWVGNFGSTLNNTSAFRTLGVLGNEEVEETTFAMYPNPTTGIINFTTSEPVDVTVMDITGKVVFTAKEINNGGIINLGSLQSGVYVAKINGASGERTEKLVIK